MGRVKKKWYTILKPCNIGFNDGAVSKSYKKDDKALLTKEQALLYKKNNLIE